MEEKLQRTGNDRTCPVAVIVRNGKILLGLRHYQFTDRDTISVWTCPGGRCEKGESIGATLCRELEEEIGVRNFEIVDFVGEVSGAHEGDTVPMFLCSTSDQVTLKEPDSFSEWRWFDKENFPKNFINEDMRKIILEIL